MLIPTNNLHKKMISTYIETYGNDDLLGTAGLEKKEIKSLFIVLAC